jgi:uncharacterized membrane protein
MEERRPSRSHNSDKDWNKISKTWILISQVMVVLFLVCLVILVTDSVIPFPYSIFLIGIEMALCLMGVFMIIRSNTIRRRKHRQNNQYR